MRPRMGRLWPPPDDPPPAAGGDEPNCCPSKRRGRRRPSPARPFQPAYAEAGPVLPAHAPCMHALLRSPPWAAGAGERRAAPAQGTLQLSSPISHELSSPAPVAEPGASPGADLVPGLLPSITLLADGAERSHRLVVVATTRHARLLAACPDQTRVTSFLLHDDNQRHASDIEKKNIRRIARPPRAATAADAARPPETDQGLPATAKNRVPPSAGS
ncbi:hypothetical protein CDD83_2427 [Cordyceps sp. RAO-2017]|nr:hypothetical protein CDD83_2427 [Cordyceps sp. RAO-2017]